MVGVELLEESSSELGTREGKVSESGKGGKGVSSNNEGTLMGEENATPRREANQHLHLDLRPLVQRPNDQATNHTHSKH